MTIVKEGYKVSILLEAKLETGEIVLKTEEENPLEVTIGEGTIPKINRKRPNRYENRRIKDNNT